MVEESLGGVKSFRLGSFRSGVGARVATMTEGQPRILAFAGSLREGSFNRKVLRYAILGAREAGGHVEELGPEHPTLPLYNGDLEENGSFPEQVEAMSSPSDCRIFARQASTCSATARSTGRSQSRLRPGARKSYSLTDCSSPHRSTTTACRVS